MTKGTTDVARHSIRAHAALAVAVLALCTPACETPPAPLPLDSGVADTGPGDSGTHDAATHDAWANDTGAPPGSTWCSVGMPVPEAVLPAGYCARLFAASPDGVLSHSPVMEPRVLAAAPNGDLFVSAPSLATPGGASGGPGAILVLSDDDLDGVAEVHTFVSGVPDVHGIVLAPDAVYFTTTSSVMRVGYTAGQRAASETPQVISAVPTPGRWTHGLARASDGTMYVSNGVVYSACPSTDTGYVAELTSGAPTTLATGLRNPMYVRCRAGTDLCVVTEMGDDGGGSYGAREKVFVLRAATDYGYPCCAGPDLPAVSGTDCSAVTAEDIVVPLGNSPFGFDWEPGVWTGPMNGAFCLAQHGSFYTSPPWEGEGVYCTPTDPTTHVPTDGFTLFFGGFGVQNTAAARMLRPADIAFGADGRMYVADDNGDAIYWVAPETLARPMP